MLGSPREKSKFERFFGALGAHSSGRVSFEVDPVRGSVVEAGADPVHRTLSCRTESSRERQPPTVPGRRAANEQTRTAHRAPPTSRRPPQVLLPPSCMSFLTIRDFTTTIGFLSTTPPGEIYRLPATRQQ